MMKYLIAASALLLGALPATAATPITYTIAYNDLPDEFGSANTANLTISLTTDGTLGFLSDSNIINWSVTATDPYKSFTLNSNNAFYNYGSDFVYASTSGLTLDYDNPDFYLSFVENSGSHNVELCGSGQCDESHVIVFFNADSDSEVYLRTGLSGSVTFPAPSAGPVPEPATWAMMIGGFALVGYALRRSRVRAAFA